MDTLASQMTRYNGRRYRMCVYPTMNGWGGFAESSSAYLGAAGPCTSRAQALARVARLIVNSSAR